VSLLPIPQSECNNFKLVIQLDHKFPYKTHPRVYLTHLPEKAETLCNDGRDFLEDIIKQSWNPSIFLVDLLEAVPNFLVLSFKTLSIMKFIRKTLFN